MKIFVDRVSETPEDLEFEITAGWWQTAMVQERDVAGKLAGPGKLACRIHFLGEDLYLDGRLSAPVELECSRCLGRYRHALCEGFRLVLEPAGDRVPSDPEGAAALARDGLCLSDELEAGWFQGKQIDLGALAVEVGSVALPVKPLCKEDCAGLCQHCGADLSAGECNCAQTIPGSPFAVLAGLRDGMTQGED